MSGEWGGSGESSSPPPEPAAAIASVEGPDQPPPSTGEQSAEGGAGPGEADPEAADPTATPVDDAVPVAAPAATTAPAPLEDGPDSAAATGGAGGAGGEPASGIAPGSEKPDQEPVAATVRSDTFLASLFPLPSPAPVAPPGERRRLPFGRSERARHRRSRRIGRKTLVVTAVLVILGGSAVAARATVLLPLAEVSQTVPPSQLVGASQHPVSWPTGVQAALAIPALGVSEDSGPETPAPIASLTKLMTAQVVLADHPLSPSEDGPSITITPADVAIYLDDENTDQANIKVAVGEVLTERQILEGMLIHSANNLADVLADWDVGSVPAFVMKMNAAARSLGMTQTTYSDASGFSTQSVSTPADQLKLASVLLQNPLVGEIVDNTSVTLPIVGTVPSYTPLVGVDDVVGVKSGFTSAAGGCDVLALSETVDGVSVEVLAAVTGYQGGGSVITGAGLDALSVARQAVAQLQSVQAVAPGERVGVASAAGYSTPLVARAGASVLAWPGQQITERLLVDRPPPSGARAGWRVGSVTAQLGLQEVTVSVATGRTLPTPSFFQRVF